MIKHFAKIIQNKLNEYAIKAGVDREFCVLTDAGEYEDVSYNPHDPRDPQDIAKKIYCILDADPSKLAPIPGLSVVTYAGTLDVMVEAKLERDPLSREFDEVARIESLLNAYSREANGTVYKYPSEDAPTFTVTVSFSPAVIGDWQVHSTVFGEAVPISMSVYLTAVESGVSANDLKLWIDGCPVYYESLVLTRQKTPDQYTYEKDESVKSTVLQHAFGVDFTAPVLNRSLSEAIVKETLSGSFNTPHVVTVEVGGGHEYVKDYLCAFGTNSLTSQPGKNVGATVSLVEVKESIASECVDTFEDDRWMHSIKNFGDFERITVRDILDFSEKGDGSDCRTLTEKKRYAFVFGCVGVQKIYYGSFVYSSEKEDLVLVENVDTALWEIGGLWLRLSHGE